MDEPNRPPIIPNEPLDLYDFYPQLVQVNPEIRKKLARRLIAWRIIALIMFLNGCLLLGIVLATGLNKIGLLVVAHYTVAYFASLRGNRYQEEVEVFDKMRMLRETEWLEGANDEAS